MMTLDRVTKTTEVPLRLDLAKAAASKLDYNGLMWANENTRLLCDLIAAGHSPFSRKSVNRYKTRAVWTANLKLLRVSALIAATGIGLEFFLSYLSGPHQYPSLDPYDGPEILVGIATIALVLFRSMYVAIHKMVAWQSVALDTYQEPIPVNVIEKALAIQGSLLQKHPQLKFGIDHLGHVPDPFLTVRGCGAMQYYVAVWNEPTFKDQPQI